MTPDYPTIQQSITNWALSQAAIRCMVLVGSRAGDTFDQWSDLDLMFYVTNKDLYRDETWLTEFGTPILNVFWEHHQAIEHLVIYENGEKVDFHFNPIEDLQDQAIAQQRYRVLQRGYQILLDKDGLTTSLIAKMPSPTKWKPTHDALIHTIKGAWYHAYRQAIALRRGDLWRAKIYDAILKQYLLTLLEWHSDAENVWYEGRDMQSWVDADTWTQLHATFGHFDTEDSWRALWATLDLFQHLTQSVAQKYDYSIDTAQSEKLRKLIQQIQQS